MCSCLQVQKELDEYGDIVFVKEKTNYKSILVKTYFVLEYAALHYDVRYILKTDDDAYINISAMLRQLRLLCQTPDCRNERLYMGKMAKVCRHIQGHESRATFDNHQWAAYQEPVWSSRRCGKVYGDDDTQLVPGARRRARCCCSRGISGTTFCSTTTPA